VTSRLIDHACRHCLGQLREVAPANDGRPSFECTGCGASSSAGHAALCACGIMAKPQRQPGPRFRCIPNPARTAARPAAVVVAFDEVAA
jgi:hypothetical protein